jgi:hypothetical protein
MKKAPQKLASNPLNVSGQISNAGAGELTRFNRGKGNQS